jgi:hypothetical protein
MILKRLTLKGIINILFRKKYNWYFSYDISYEGPNSVHTKQS